MSCDHELANEWARCSGKNARYITIKLPQDPKDFCDFTWFVSMLFSDMVAVYWSFMLLHTLTALHRSHLALSSSWWFCVPRVILIVFFPKVNVVIWRLGLLTSKVLFIQRKNGKFRFIQFRKAFYWSKWVGRVRLCSARHVKELRFIGHSEVSKWIRPVLRNNGIALAKRKRLGLNIEIGTFVTILKLFHSTRAEQIYSSLVKHATKDFVGNPMKLSEFLQNWQLLSKPLIWLIASGRELRCSSLSWLLKISMASSLPVCFDQPDSLNLNTWRLVTQTSHKDFPTPFQISWFDRKHGVRDLRCKILLR